VQEVNRLLNQFGEMQKMMKQMQKGGLAKMMRAMKGMMPGMR
jgi:signal recognition particle subunit SRP54